ncbi:MAG: ATP-binding cassette domain-containing protein [Anaeroplasmataceae bacterium]|nr:ATP-binding cassette domain-containing protein [Anaeroplasmataceae bacterium]
MKVNQMSIQLKSGRTIISNCSFSLNHHDKLAIIGEEGNGKSTILKFIYNKNLIEDYCECSGTLDIPMEKIGYLEQYIHSKWHPFGVMDFFLYDDVHKDPNYEVYNEFYKIETLFKKYNIDLNLIKEIITIYNLYGGEKIKLQLIKIILKNPELILLDEPTNDLDLDSILLLEKFISTTSIPIIFVSHDEELISKTANIILHLEQMKRKTEMKYTYIKSDYNSYISLRTSQLEQQNMDAYRTRKEKDVKLQKLKHQHLLVENDLDRAVRNPGWGSLLAKKMKNIKSQEKKIESLPVVDYAQPEEAIHLSFFSDVFIPNGKVILDLSNYALKIEQKILSHSITLKIVGPKHYCIIGKNGTGKTTLIKQIYFLLKDRTDIRLGYMPQNYDDAFTSSYTPVTYLQHFVGFNSNTKSQIMTFLGAMNFQEFEMLNTIDRLSGGQKAKLYLVKLILLKCNVLILDEPTRNLSPLSNPVIRNLLANFKGTILAITHDRKMLEEVADEVFELTENGLKQIQ